MKSCRCQGGVIMIRLTLVFLLAMLWTAALTADEPKDISQPPEIVLDAPPAQKEDPSMQAAEVKAVTVFESKFFPGFRPCTSQDYHNHDFSPVACQDNDTARVLSTREDEESASLVESEVISQGNIYKLRFERFFKSKNR